MNQYAPEMKKYLVDTNPSSLDKSLDMFLVFLGKVDKGTSIENMTSWINCLITKGVTFNKPAIVDKALEALSIIMG